MMKVWLRIIALAEVLGGCLALIATIAAARAGASKTAILLGSGLDVLVVVSGVLLWFKPATGIVLSEIVQGLQCLQIITARLAWQYVAGAALLAQVMGGEMSWSGGLLVRHTLLQEGGNEAAGLGVNLVAVGALTFLVMSQKRTKRERRQGSA
jgi:hypothetical protein